LRHLEISEWNCNDKTKSIGFGKLSIQQHRGMVFSKWLSSLTNISEISASQYSNGFSPLSMLKYLRINANNMSLKNLDFDYLSDQQLEVIEIWFKNNPKCLPSLQKITFYNCYNLKILPDWICNLSSLQHIGITSCRNLALLLEGMSRLTNLCTLEIIECPVLIEECRAEASATWTKIARIPNIMTRDW